MTSHHMMKITPRQSGDDDMVFGPFKIDDRAVGEGEFKELETRIKTKERELSQLRQTTEKDVAVLTEELDSIETELRLSLNKRMKAEQEIRRLHNVIENCDENISRMEQEKKTKESLIERNLENLTAAEVNLSEEIEKLRSSQLRKTEPVLSSEKQKLISFLTRTIKEKEEAIRERESDLECPVCLQTAGGEIFSCAEQHLVCSQCRPRVTECPQCRQPYPPTPIRHRYAEKSVRQLERLREELGQVVSELYEMNV